MGAVIALVWSYGLWMALAVVFLTMHWFGMHYCGSGRERRTPRVRPGPSQVGPDSGAEGKKVKEEA